MSIDNSNSVCKVRVCNETDYFRGFCREHLDTLSKYSNAPHNECAIDGCGGKKFSLGFCTKHYQRFLKNGHPLRMRRGSYELPEAVVEKSIAEGVTAEKTEEDSLVLRIEIFKPSKDISLRVIVEDHQQSQEIRILGSDE